MRSDAPPPVSRSAAAASVTGLAIIGWRLGGTVAAVLGVLVALAAPTLVRRARRRRVESRYDDQLLAMLRSLARSLRSGATLRVALHEATGGVTGPVGRDLALLVDDLDDGVADALRRWSIRRPSPSVQLVAGGLALGYATGGITAVVVDSLADNIRLRLEGRDETSALAAQATLSAVILAAAPLGFMVLGAVGGSRSSRFLLERPLGRVCLAVGLLLDAGSLLWMLRMVRRFDT